MRSSARRLTDWSGIVTGLLLVVLALAVNKAGTVEKSKVRDQIATLDAHTFYGHIKFGPTGQIESLKPPTMQIQNGQPTVVDPVEIKQADIRFEPK